MAEEFDYLRPAAPIAAQRSEAGPRNPEDDFAYLRDTNAKAAPDDQEAIRQAIRDQNMWYGGAAGAAASGAGAPIRGTLSAIKEFLGRDDSSILNKFDELKSNMMDKATGAGKAISNYTLSLMKHDPNAQTISNPEAQNILSSKEAQAKLEENVGKIREVQAKNPSAKVISPEVGLMGNTTGWIDPMTGEMVNMPSMTIKDPVTGKTRTVPDPKAIEAYQKVQAQARANAPKPTDPFFDAVKNAGRTASHWLSDVGHGVAHGVNAALQTQAAIDEAGANAPKAVAHGVSALGSMADIASPIMSDVWRHGVRKYVSPLAFIGSGAADVLGGVSDITTPRQPNESQAEYEQRKNTGRMSIPMAIAKTGLGMINPVAGFAAYAPPLSLEYAKRNPEQVKKWVDMGIYENPETMMYDLKPPVMNPNRAQNRLR